MTEVEGDSSHAGCGTSAVVRRGHIVGRRVQLNQGGVALPLEQNQAGDTARITLDERQLRAVAGKRRRGNNRAAIIGGAALRVGGVVLPINRGHGTSAAAIKVVVSNDGRLRVRTAGESPAAPREVALIGGERDGIASGSGRVRGDRHGGAGAAAI